MCVWSRPSRRRCLVERASKAVSFLLAIILSAVSARGADLLEGLGEVYRDAGQIGRLTSPVVCYVDMQHPDLARKDLGMLWGHAVDLKEVKQQIEVELAGLPCLVVHYTQLTPEMARNKNIKALNIGTRAKAISRAQDEAFYALLRETDIPTLALHGGQGILASAYGAKTGPMRDLRPGEPDPYPAYEPGRFKEWGFCTVRVAKRDPLFDGLGDEIVVEEAHASEVKELPADLVLLAASKECPVQVFKHRSKLQYGVQFRANRYDDQHPDGKAILRNFFRAAGIDVARTVPVALESFRAVQMEGIQDLYEPPARLRTRSKPLICYVDTERPDLIQQRQKGPAGRRQADKLARVKKQLEAVTPLPVLVVHYTQIHKTDFDPKTARTILVSGRSYPIIDVLTRELFVLIRETRIPTFGFCGGHQLIAQAYGAKVGSMRPLKPGEKDPAPFHGPGLFKEWGFLPVRTVKTDPLFQGLGTTLVVQEYHYGEVKELPEGFDLLASDDECRIQAMKHRDKILYGTQFHPEDYDEKHPDGRQILKNFFRIAGVAVR